MKMMDQMESCNQTHKQHRINLRLVKEKKTRTSNVKTSCRAGDVFLCRERNGHTFIGMIVNNDYNKACLITIYPKNGYVGNRWITPIFVENRNAITQAEMDRMMTNLSYTPMKLSEIINNEAKVAVGESTKAE